VTFDSAGISLGVLRANLCINSNAPLSPTVQVPVILEVPPAPSLVLTKTVGLDPNVCATADNIIVPAGQGGTAVTYCYTVQNTGNITLTVQNLVDDQLGVLLGPDAPFEVAPKIYCCSINSNQLSVQLACFGNRDIDSLGLSNAIGVFSAVASIWRCSMGFRSAAGALDGSQGFEAPQAR
jgi:hypothetical protein